MPDCPKSCLDGNGTPQNIIEKGRFSLIFSHFRGIGFFRV